MTTVFNSVQAGHHLGVSDRSIRNLIGRGELRALSVDPVRLDPAHVADVLRLRQMGALNELARRQRTPVDLARDVRRSLLRQETGGVLPGQRAESQRRRLGLLPDAAKSLFGTAALDAVFLEAGCRWCKAAEYAAKLPGYWAPTSYAAGFRVLFDQDPCERCGPALYGGVLASLRARVHPGGEPPSAARVAPSEAEREAAQDWVRRHPVAAAARPVEGDNGKAMVSRRRREVTARLKEARRRGDTQHAFALQRQLQVLVADAARIDGRAAAPRGRKRCGTPVGTRCECHVSDRKVWR